MATLKTICFTTGRMPYPKLTLLLNDVGHENMTSVNHVM